LSQEDGMGAAKPIPDDYPQITPYLCVDRAAEAIEFYSQVFGATERMRMGGPGGKVGHAELQLGAGVLMLSDEFPDRGIRGPRTIGGSPVTLSVYVEDVDAVYDRAVAAGATGLRPVEDQFYGDRTGQFEDPFGHRWSVATHVEDVPPDEMAQRVAELDAEQGVTSEPG
jgi:PhnB protein